MNPLTPYRISKKTNALIPRKRCYGQTNGWKQKMDDLVDR